MITDIWKDYAAGVLDDDAAQDAAEALTAKLAELHKARQRTREARRRGAEATTVPRHLRRRRDKVFGDGRCVPLDRNAKARIMVLARALMRRTEARKHYGRLTAKHVAVLGALLFGFHNTANGRCFPAYPTIAERADCDRSTVYEAIHALEQVGLLSWVNRIARVRERVPDMFGGHMAGRWRVVRTSNAYAFNDPSPSKSELPTGTVQASLKLHIADGAPRPSSAGADLMSALERLGSGVVRSRARN